VVIVRWRKADVSVRDVKEKQHALIDEGQEERYSYVESKRSFQKF